MTELWQFGAFELAAMIRRRDTSNRDIVDVTGTPITKEVPIMAEAIADTDAPVVERMRATGSIPMCRHTTLTAARSLEGAVGTFTPVTP